MSCEDDDNNVSSLEKATKDTEDLFQPLPDTGSKIEHCNFPTASIPTRPGIIGQAPSINTASAKTSQDAENLSKVGEKDFFTLSGAIASDTIEEGQFSTQDVIEDRFRYLSGKYWKVKESGSIEYEETSHSSSANGLFDINIVGTERSDNIGEFITTFGLKPVSELRGTQTWKDIVFGRDENIGINIDFSPRDAPTSEGFITQSIPGVAVEEKIFKDYSFERSSPIHESKVDNVDVGFSFFDVEPTYNFYSDEYEMGSSLVENENIIPNFYNLQRSFQNDYSESTIEHVNLRDEDLSGEINLGSQEKSNIVESDVFDNRNKNLFQIGNYVDSWGTKIRDKSEELIDEIASPFQNLFLTIEDIESGVISKLNNKIDIMPFWVRFNFDTESTNHLTPVIAEINQDEGLFDEFSSRNGPLFSEESWGHVRSRFLENEEGEVNVRNNFSNKETSVFDLSEWVESISEEPLMQIQMDFENGSPRFLLPSAAPGEKNSVLVEFKNSSPQDKMSSTLQKIIFGNKVDEVVQQNSRDFADILNGDKAHSESIGYVIEKYRITGGEPEPEPVQRVFLPNSNEVNELEYFDTQIKYDSPYRYEVKALDFVVAAEYEYGGITLDSSENAQILCRVNNKPKIVETPYFKTDSVRVLDNAPLPPNVEPIPFKDNPNEIEFWFDNATGVRKEEYIAIQPEDKKEIEKYMRKRYIANPFTDTVDQNSKVTFKLDDEIDTIEIFRVESKPTEISDFEGTKIAETDHMSFKDNIETNKDYYYIFRGVDIHGHFSNPTDVFKIRMVSDDNSSDFIPEINVMEIDDLERNRINRTAEFRRFMKIKPAFKQMFINEERSNLNKKGENLSTEDVKLGDRNIEQIWGDRYKIRVRSTATGKIVDLNLKFLKNFDNKLKKAKDSTTKKHLGLVDVKNTLKYNLNFLSDD